MSRATLIRIGPGTKAGYDLQLFEGEEASVLERSSLAGTPKGTPDVISTIPPGPVGLAAPDGIRYIDLGDARDTLAAADNTGHHELRDLGIQLWGLLQHGEIGGRWSQAQLAARKSRLTPGVHLRTWLEIQDPGLARLPWELMQDPVTGAKLALEEWSTVLRRAAGAPPDLPGKDAELRVLFVVGCHPVEDAQIRWLDELRSFLLTVCAQRNAVDFEVFEAHARWQDGVKKNLRKAIEDFRPHILHFVGHGKLDGVDPALECFDKSTGERLSWTSQEFKQWLSKYPPRIVVLNACRTSAEAADGGAPIKVLSSMAAAAHAAGAACVIAMQDDIDGGAAALFAEGVYGALVAGRPIDQAVVQGRERITDRYGLEDRNWALPVCSLSISPDEVLPRFDVIRPEVRESVKAQADEQLKIYVGRRPERRLIVDPGTGTAGTHVRFVVGDADMGKSMMARLVCEWRMLLGHRVLYLDCSKATGKALDALELMRQIRGFDQVDAPLRPRLYPEFKEFNDTVNEVLANKPHGALPSTGHDEGKPLDRKTFAERGWDRLCGAFVDGLKQAGKAQSLTIVLDHLSRNTAGVDCDDFKNEIVTKVLLPIHKGDVEGVSVIICGRENEIGPCGLSAMRSASKGVAELKDFVREDWELLAREFAVRGEMRTELAEKVIALLGSVVQGSWKPKMLLAMRYAYDGGGV